MVGRRIASKRHIIYAGSCSNVNGQGDGIRCQQERLLSMSGETSHRRLRSGGSVRGCSGPSRSSRGSERITRAGGRSILGGKRKEFRVQQTKLLCQSRGTGSTRPGSGSVNGSSVAQRNESEAQLSIRLSDEPVEGGIHGVTVRVELRLTPSWLTVRRERRDTA